MSVHRTYNKHIYKDGGPERDIFLKYQPEHFELKSNKFLQLIKLLCSLYGSRNIYYKTLHNHHKQKTNETIVNKSGASFMVLMKKHSCTYLIITSMMEKALIQNSL